MYKKGNAKLLINLSALSDEEQDRHWDNCLDPEDHSRAPCGDERIVALPHSCDQWVIGGLAELDQMIEDLQAIRKEMGPR